MVTTRWVWLSWREHRGYGACGARGVPGPRGLRHRDVTWVWLLGSEGRRLGPGVPCCPRRTARRPPPAPAHALPGPRRCPIVVLPWHGGRRGHGACGSPDAAGTAPGAHPGISRHGAGPHGERAAPMPHCGAALARRAPGVAGRAGSPDVPGAAPGWRRSPRRGAGDGSGAAGKTRHRAGPGTAGPPGTRQGPGLSLPRSHTLTRSPTRVRAALRALSISTAPHPPAHSRPSFPPAPGPGG